MSSIDLHESFFVVCLHRCILIVVVADDMHCKMLLIALICTTDFWSS